MSDTTQIATTNGQPASRTSDRRFRRQLADQIRLKTRLLTLGDLDRRTNAFKQASNLINQLSADLGNDLTAAQTQLITRAALTATMIEDLETRYLAGHPIDPTVHATLTNSLRRLLETTGITRTPRDVSPSLNDIARHLSEASEVTEQADDEQDEVTAVKAADAA